MTVEERIGELCATVRREAVDDLLRFAARVRTEGAAAIEEASRIFEPAAVEFLKSLAPTVVPHEEIDLRAQRFARVRVAEIQLYHAAAMKQGRASGDVYSALKVQIDAAREAYRAKFFTSMNGTADYLHAEFVRTLANDDARLLGPQYPGPLV